MSDIYTSFLIAGAEVYQWQERQIHDILAYCQNETYDNVIASIKLYGVPDLKRFVSLTGRLPRDDRDMWLEFAKAQVNWNLLGTVLTNR